MRVLGDATSEASLLFSQANPSVRSLKARRGRLETGAFFSRTIEPRPSRTCRPAALSKGGAPMAAGASLVTPALYQSLRRRLVAAEQIALPTREPANQIIVDIFRRTSDQKPAFDFFGVFVLSPAVTSLAERDFVPLCGLVIVAGLGKFLAMPDLTHALFEHVTHVGCPYSVETAQPYAAVVVHRHGLVDNRARHALGRLDHVG